MKKYFILFISGFVLAAVIILSIRWFAPAPKKVHYHANFALFINGKRDEFKDPTYYEELLSCNTLNHMTPKDRAHMHGNVNDVVHVHAELATWEQFFNNLGYSIGQNFVATHTEIYAADTTHKVTFMLNGKKIENAANLVIGSEDRLLISYGSESDSELQKQYATIGDSAKKYNVGKDPASCSSGAGLSWRERLNNLF